MRIIVMSDSHRNFRNVQRVMEKHPDADLYIHLGDGEREFEDVQNLYPDRRYLWVAGNCDFGSLLPWEEELSVEGKKIFFTHGYTYQVKMTLYNLECAARDRKADIALYGHTHQAEIEYRDGLYLMNPGSLHGSYGTYGIIDITPAGLVPNIVKNYRD